MYLTYYGLSDKPFKTGWDPKYLWLEGKFRGCLEALAQGVLRGDALQVITGEEGIGKTTLANAMPGKLGEGVVAAIVPCPEYEGIDLFKLIAKAWGISGALPERDSPAARVSDFLREARSAGKKALLIIDDAHRLTKPWLQALSDLSGLEENGSRLAHLVLFGESSLETSLVQESSGEFAAKITFRGTLDPLTREETARYIEHRLKVAQCGQELFTPGAVDEIFSYSGGVPRLVNKACDAALSRNFYINETVVKAETIRNFLKLMPEERTAPVRSTADSRAGHAAAGKDAGSTDEAQRLPSAPGQETWRRVTYAALGCFVAAVAGFTLYVMSSSQQSPPAKPEPPKAAAPAQEAGKSEPAANGAVRGTITAKPKPSGASASVRAPGTEGMQTARPARRQAAAPAPAQGGSATREAPPRGSAGEPEPDKVIDWLIKKRAEKQ